MEHGWPVAFVAKGPWALHSLPFESERQLSQRNSSLHRARLPHSLGIATISFASFHFLVRSRGATKNFEAMWYLQFNSYVDDIAVTGFVSPRHGHFADRDLRHHR